jgi:type I restriction enzyme, R subunit
VSKSPTESQTRQHLIDNQLAEAGWSRDQRNLIEEYLLDDRRVESHDPYATFVTGNEYADYVLLGENGKPMAIVEAKRTSRDALAGQRQAADYADRIRSHCDSDPFIFLTNGNTTWFWDRPGYPLREISRFFTREDLERFLFQRAYRQPLSELGPNP